MINSTTTVHGSRNPICCWLNFKSHASNYFLFFICLFQNGFQIYPTLIAVPLSTLEARNFLISPRLYNFLHVNFISHKWKFSLTYTIHNVIIYITDLVSKWPYTAYSFSSNSRSLNTKKIYLKYAWKIFNIKKRRNWKQWVLFIGGPRPIFGPGHATLPITYVMSVLFISLSVYPSVCPSVCQSAVRIFQRNCYWTNFQAVLILGTFMKNCGEKKICYKSGKIPGNLHEDLSTFYVYFSVDN
jgi:hypothetical protein